MAPPGTSPGTPASASGNATILIYLSLFLLLLVFFIVLAAHSVPRDYRVRAAMDSVERRFAPPSDGVGSDSPTARGTAIALTGLKRLGEMFEADLAIVKVDQVSRGHLMVVSLPADQLFEDGSAFVRHERIGLLDRIAHEIGDHGGIRFDVDFLVAIGNEPAGQGPRTAPVAQAAALARALIADRAPPDALAVGLEPGVGGTVRFLFTAHNTTEPRTGAAKGGPRAPQ